MGAQRLKRPIMRLYATSRDGAAGSEERCAVEALDELCFFRFVPVSPWRPIINTFPGWFFKINIVFLFSRPKAWEFLAETDTSGNIRPTHAVHH
jgi:hypothetical protein